MLPVNKNQEKELVQKAKKDPEAFVELYNFYFPKIFRFAAYRVSSLEDTEDVVADIFEKALKHLANFRWRENANFGSWLFQIARNTIIDYYKKNSRGHLVNLADLPEIASHEILPSDAVKRKEGFQELQKLVNTLPARQAEIVALRFFGERRNKEIAQIFKISEKTVASNLCRALRTLHRRYKDLQ